MGKAAVFIVEDERLVAEDIKETLKSKGYSVTGIAKSGELAIEMIKETRPDLVLMDIHLAGKMDGIEAAEQIRSLYNIPVIYLTAYADKELLERAKVTEPYGYILKPYDERELHSAVEVALYRHKIDNEIKKRDEILFAVSFAVEWFLRLPKKEPREHLLEIDRAVLEEMLEQFGLAVDLSSIGIFRMQPDSAGNPVISMKYEWVAAGTVPKIHNPIIENFTFADRNISRWQDLISKGQPLYGNVRDFPENEQHFLAGLEVKSLAVLPVFIRDTLWGFIGFFTSTDREWSAEEMEALMITANLISAAMGQS